MPNKLQNENSPYLLQHAGNPVEWYPWGPEALEKARLEDKPIFLSIGYAACHWCHVMAHESFEDTATAALMNASFVNIKVDREERPDLDGIYMNAVVAMAGQGGWPLSVFLTPTGQPFFGGTYFPPDRRYNMPAFRDVLDGVSRAWRTDRAGIQASSEKITDYLVQLNKTSTSFQEPESRNLEQAALALAQAYDWKFGGWGQAPKFPQPMAIEFLLRRAVRDDQLAQEMAIHALFAMSLGGMYDVVGGGFARYSTDNNWLVPHFEKMLYDNAQLARVYLAAYMVTGTPRFRQVTEETLDFIVRELSHPQGGFYSSLDADSEGEEGKFYGWSPAEIREALADDRLSELITAAYGVSQAGNFEGANVLQRTLDDLSLAEQFQLTETEVASRLAEAHRRLLRSRSKRVRPGTDDKVLVTWNALAMIAFAEAGRYLNRQDYAAQAAKNASFLLEQLWDGKQLYRSWRSGRAAHNAYLEDYAALALGLISLYQTDGSTRWYTAAVQMAEEMLAHFKDPDFGFFDTRLDHEALLTRPKDLQDNATPCGNSLAALALLQLYALTGRNDFYAQTEQALGVMQSQAARYPTAFGQWLAALDSLIHPIKEVAVVGPLENKNTQALLRAVWSQYRPDVVLAVGGEPAEQGSPPLLADRPMRAGSPTAYVCRQFVCLQPASSPDELLEQLNKPPAGLS